VGKPDQSLDYSEKLRCAGTSYLGGCGMTYKEKEQIIILTN
jgi:hypothetical protein